MYRAVIFDLDGTLLDSIGEILYVLNGTLSRFGLPEITRAEAISYIGNGARELVRLAIGEENVHRLDEILAYYKEAYAGGDNSLARLFDGEAEALKKMKDAGVKLAVLTNKPHAAAVKAEEKFFGEYSFDIFCGQREGVPLKPAPDAVYAILDALGVDGKDCLFIGDGEADVLTAKNAGIDCVSVLWGYRTEEQLKAAGADTFAANFDELCDKIVK